MLDLDDNKKVYLYSGYTDMRLGMFGLLKLISNPNKNSIYAFCGKNLKTVKIVIYQETYAVLYIKRLFKGKMIWPTNNEVCESTIKVLRMFIETPDEINKLSFKNQKQISFY